MEDVPKNKSLVEENGNRYMYVWRQEELVGCTVADEVITLCFRRCEGVGPVNEFISDEEIEERRLALEKLGPIKMLLKCGESCRDPLGRLWYRDMDGRVYKIVKKEFRKTENPAPVQSPYPDNETWIKKMKKQAEDRDKGFVRWLNHQNKPDPVYLP
jgi:hypothetical protein